MRSSFKSFAINIGLIRLASADLGAGRLQVADFAGLLSPGALAGGLSHGHFAATAERCALFHQSSVSNASLGFTAQLLDKPQSFLDVFLASAVVQNAETQDGAGAEPGGREHELAAGKYPRHQILV